MANKSSMLSDQLLANIYQQLSRLEQAGFSAQQAFELLEKTGQKHKRAIHQLQKLLKSGQTVSEAGYRAGIFSSVDKALLSAGETSGQSARIYQQLADHYSDKAKRARRVKSQLYLPVFILVLALFIQPLPALILDQITGLDYLAVTVGSVVKIALFFYIVIKLPFWLTTGWLRFLGVERLIYQLQLSLPVVAQWIVNRQINVFLHTLGLLLWAGLPALEALPKAIGTIKNKILRQKFEPLIAAIDKGQSLVEALSKISEIDQQTKAQILVGEQSGRLAETILHMTKINTEKINLQQDLLAEWIPRLFYFLVVAWLAFSLLNSNIISTINL